MRISGLASGMDTDSMIKELMKAERVKVDRVEQQRQLLKWKQEIYNTLNKDFANFILNAKKDFGYVNGRSGSMNWHKKATSSDESKATVSSTLGTVIGKHDITVDRLADGVSAASSSNISKGDKSNVASQFNLNANDKLEFTIESKNGPVKFVFGELDEATENALKGELNTVYINKSLDELSLSDVVNKINSASVKDASGNVISDLGVKASYDKGIDRFFLQTTNTGKNNAMLKIDASAGSTGEKFINDLNLKVKSYDNNGDKLEANLTTGNVYNGVNAKISYNGVDDIEKESNSFEINGLNVNLKDVGSFSVNVSTDTEAIVEKVKNFVEEYNKLIEKAGKLLREKTNRNYKPLTSEEKKAMNEKDIELWEEMAKGGLLRNDMSINNTLSSMRSDLYKEINTDSGVFKLLTEIGISTDKYSTGSIGGQLKVDEDKLRKAIDRDADAVIEVLFKESDLYNKDDDDLSKDDLAKKRANSGIVTRIFDNLILGMKDIIDRSGTGSNDDLFRKVKSNILIDFVIGEKNLSKQGSVSFLDYEVNKLNKKIEDLEVLLFRKENSYYAKFTAMEKAMQKMSSQTGWITQQMGGKM
ncbi:flagellar hook-associated protein 2 [Gottschalkia purinilytica]|uniref:Flagellar hook-associated protein 2 n=1 Tax=Gottschalkia purinilytica TaxID=1503 RepID=A0A0L0WDT7_GOTPU|nr:flagellar filament capping protein FliD [Gottschalkia purinilytica]KNF09639.1 flagellar hook-associated protein 2 [Gottschalkia purinilytica]